VVNRDYAGQRIGADLLDWAAMEAATEYGAARTRIDVWTTNAALHAYYERIGFLPVRIVRENGWDCPAGALFQRPIEGSGYRRPDAADG
jgi:GNAT superfamily N-acetyltransferase